MNVSSLKRKRRPGVGSIPRGFRPNALSSPPLALVDYDEDDDLGVVGPAARATPPAPSPQKALLSHSREMPTSPRMSHRQIPASTPPKRTSAADDQDNMLETLVRSKTVPPSAPPVVILPEIAIGPMRPGGKRRRDEEEDGLLERLSKAKKVDPGGQKGGPGRTSATRVGDDPPKKMKLKFGATSLAVASPSPSTPSPSEPGAKDRDTG